MKRGSLLKAVTDCVSVAVSVVESDDRLQSRESDVGRTSRQQQLEILEGERERERGGGRKGERERERDRGREGGGEREGERGRKGGREGERERERERGKKGGFPMQLFSKGTHRY